MTVLKAHQERQEAEKDEWGDAYEDDGWIFAKENGTPISPDWFTRETKQACKGAGVPVMMPHGFRHLAASLLPRGQRPYQSRQ